MRRVWLALSICVALCVLLAPRTAEADMICQHKKSKKTVIRPACVGKYALVHDLGAIDQLQAEIRALQASVEGASGDSAESLTGRVQALVTQLSIGALSLAALQTRLPVKANDLAVSAVTREKVAANAIDGEKVADASLGFGDLAFSLIVPYPASAIGTQWRVVAADLDMSEAAGVSVENQTGANWLELTTLNTADVSADFASAAGVFVGSPQSLASVTDAGSPNAPDALEVSVVETGTPPADFVRVRVRVVGTSRRFDVHGTLFCMGVAQL